MKTSVVIAAVIALHVAIIGGVLLIGGCKSLPPAMRPKEKAPPPPPVVEAPVTPIVPPPPPPAPPAERTYTVKAGDSLSKIAKAEGVSLSALLTANNLTVKSVIHPGQTLTIASAGAPSGTAATAGTTYTVKKGDTLSKIAKTHGTTVDALIEVNHLKSDVIRISQKLKIPTTTQSSAAKHHKAAKPKAAAKAAPAAAAAEGGKYTVQSGDTPGSIAKKLGVKVSELMATNKITDPKKLRIGQVLTIPGKVPVASTPTATLPPAPPAETPPAPTTPPAAGTTTPPPVTPVPAGSTPPPSPPPPQP